MSNLQVVEAVKSLTLGDRTRRTITAHVLQDGFPRIDREGVGLISTLDIVETVEIGLYLLGCQVGQSDAKR